MSNIFLNLHTDYNLQTQNKNSLLRGKQKIFENIFHQLFIKEYVVVVRIILEKQDKILALGAMKILTSGRNQNQQKIRNSNMKPFCFNNFGIH